MGSSLEVLLTIFFSLSTGLLGCGDAKDKDEARDTATASEPDGGDGADGGGGDGGDTDPGTRDGGEDDTSPSSWHNRCQELSDDYGALYCAHEVHEPDVWYQLTVPSMRMDAGLLTKYVFSIEDEIDLPLTFLNVNINRLHYDFLVNGYPEVFDGISPVTYLDMATDGSDRKLLVGIVYEFVTEGDPLYGFTILDDAAAPEKVVTERQAEQVYEALIEQFTLGEMVFVPETSAQTEAVQRWSGTIPVLGGIVEIEYEVYTAAEGYGTVRMMSLTELAAATYSGAVGYQDILVLDEAPSDLETVVSGTVTGTRQGILSHLNVRSAARGTPNCYIPTPRERLKDWEGKLVQLTCGPEHLDIREATPAEAESAWAALRPPPLILREPDTTSDMLAPLVEISSDTAASRMNAIDTYGAKTANLATLYQRIDTALQYPGFGVPFHYYRAFLDANTFSAETAAGVQQLSFGEAIETWLREEAFLSDTAYRRSRLLSLQRAMLAAPVDDDLIAALHDAITDVFGDDETMVRFRSSSNAEDALSFSGAGLYDSTSACLADTLDDDAQGPSRCDPDEEDERDLARAVRIVWASLWNPAAFEERAFYGIDHEQTVMGILVNTRTKDEAANIVAFTGNPLNGDSDYLINAQLGAWDVVSSTPGIFPETTLLEMIDGEVSTIDRVSESSQVASGEVVLSDAALHELGRRLYEIETVFPVDAEPPAGRQLFLDTEWKLLEDNTFIVKQIRPFLY